MPFRGDFIQKGSERNQEPLAPAIGLALEPTTKPFAVSASQQRRPLTQRFCTGADLPVIESLGS